MRDFCYGFEVRDVEFGVADGFSVDSAGFWGYAFLNSSGSDESTKITLRPSLGRCSGEFVGSAVEVVGGNDFVTHSCDCIRAPERLPLDPKPLPMRLYLSR
jgi:hypothetical protein